MNKNSNKSINDFIKFPLPYDNIYCSNIRYDKECINLNKDCGCDKVALRMILVFWILIYRSVDKINFPLVYVSENKFYKYIISNTSGSFKYIFDDFLVKKSEEFPNNLNEINIIFAINNKKIDDISLNKNIIVNINYKCETIVEIYYNKLMFKKNTIIRMLNNFVYLLEQIERNSDLNIGFYDIVSDAEKQLISRFNSRKENLFNNKTYIECFYDNLKNFSEKIAMVEGNCKLTYEKFNSITNYYAKKLMNIKENNIGIYLKSDICTYIAIISIFKAGKCLVTINPSFPRNRIKYIIDVLKINTVLTCDKTDDIIHSMKMNSMNISNYINFDYNIISTVPNILNKKPMDASCYITFTSGSTGNPKGVIISQKNIITELIWMHNYFHFDCTFKSLHILNYSFDFGLYDILSNLLYGGCLFSINKNTMKSFSDYIDFININKINNINTTPSFFNILASFNVKLSTLKHVHLGGEKVTYELLDRYVNIISDDCEIYNGYGPCECTVGSNIHKITFEEKYDVESRRYSSIPIGFPTDDSYIYILDDNYMDVPINAIGEIYIAGDGVGIGYVDSKFNENCFIYLKSKNNMRVYKTGDLARWLENGEVEFINRKDSQVKINGFRIELAEIDYCFSKIDDIKDSKTIAINNCIISFVLGKKKFSTKIIKDFLSQYLPNYMLPTKIIQLNKFPYLDSGKIDIKQLEQIYKKS